jgi:two-component system C4-dicarboxylate transport sensor histidine kinase DctB
MNGEDDARWLRVAQLAELGVMSASLLHELRQPLFAVKGLLELEIVGLGEGPDRRLRQALGQIEHMEELLRVYGQPGRAEDEATVFDLADPVRASIGLLGHRSRQADAILRGSFSDQPEVVRAREGSVRQIAINLIHNALDAVEGRPVRQVDVWVGHDEGGGVLEVRDTGGGIPEGLQVFEAFVTTKPVGRGTGLGLYIARTLARQAGGELEVVSTGEHGTVIRLRVPRV